MSLLMDALKKAEKEKQEAANRKDETGPNPLLSSTSELPIDAVATESDLPDFEEDTNAYQQVDDDSGLSLEPIDSLDSLSDDELPDTGTYPAIRADEQVSEPADIEQEDEHFDNTQELNRTDSQALSEFEQSIASSLEPDTTTQLSFENTQTMENELGESEPEEDYNDYISLDAETSLRLEGFAGQETETETEASEPEEPELVDNIIATGNTSVSLNTDQMPYSGSLETVSNEQFVDMLGDGGRKPTPAAADTVFRAAAQEKSWLKSSKGLGVLVVILLLSLGLGAVIFYWTTPQVYQMPSPSLAQGTIQDQTMAAGMLTPVAPTQIAEPTESDSVEASDTPATTDTVYVDHSAEDNTLSEASAEERYGPLVDESVSDSTPANSATASEVTQNSTVEALAPTEQTAVVPAEIEANSQRQTEEQLAALEQESPVAASAQEPTVSTEADVVSKPTLKQTVSEEMIQITRAVKTANNENTNQQAYAAYQKGDYQIASMLYNKVLQERPENRDALMGLAAIDVIHQKPAEAYRRYRQILVSRPDDVDARLAIINLKGLQKDNESLIKLMLQNQPDSAELYSSLGNIYASQQRWAEAQQMFFEAFRRASNDADNALNLAVSLDQLGQSKAAKDYYQKALNLADASRTPGFDTQTVLKRVQAITTEP